MKNYMISEQILTAPCEAAAKAQTYTFALIYCLDTIRIGKTSELLENEAEVPIDWNIVTEARFFDVDGELHLFYSYEDGWKCVALTDEIQDAEMLHDKRVLLAKKYQTSGKYLQIREYLEEDDDGQVFTKHTRLVGIL